MLAKSEGNIHMIFNSVEIKVPARLEIIVAAEWFERLFKIVAAWYSLQLASGTVVNVIGKLFLVIGKHGVKTYLLHDPSSCFSAMAVVQERFRYCGPRDGICSRAVVLHGSRHIQDRVHYYKKVAGLNVCKVVSLAVKGIEPWMLRINGAILIRRPFPAFRYHLIQV